MEDCMPEPHESTGGRVLRLLFSSARTYSTGSLSADSQIARALYHAQIDAGRGAMAKPKSLDEIAALAQEASGWTLVFKLLKSEGLIEEQTLGQVVASWNNRYGRPGASGELEAALQNAPLHAPSQTAS
jgi:hypothetical protein